MGFVEEASNTVKRIIAPPTVAESVSDMQRNIMANVRASIEKNTQNKECGWKAIGSIQDLFFAHLTGQAIGGAQYDLEVDLPQGYNEFSLVSISDNGNSVFLSLGKTGKTNPLGGGAIVVAGTEEWFPMTTAAGGVSGPNYFAVIKFRGYTNVVYVSLGHESGAQNICTIACGRDGSLSGIRGGIWT